MFTLAAAWVCLFAWITLAGLPTDLHKVDCIIVPGARADKNGLPGVSLQARLDRAIELYRAGWAPVLLLTGGQGASGAIEGEVAQRYAVTQGVPIEATEFEGQSHTTHGNFLYAHQIMEKHGWRNCLIVTDPFHERRCLMLARDFGIEAYPAPTFNGPGWKRWDTWLFYTVRETAAMVKYGWEYLTVPS